VFSDPADDDTCCKKPPNVIQLSWLNEAWPMDAKVTLVVSQAGETNSATDEMLAKAPLLHVLSWTSYWWWYGGEIGADEQC